MSRTVMHRLTKLELKGTEPAPKRGINCITSTGRTEMLVLLPEIDVSVDEPCPRISPK